MIQPTKQIIAAYDPNLILPTTEKPVLVGYYDPGCKLHTVQAVYLPTTGWYEYNLNPHEMHFINGLVVAWAPMPYLELFYRGDNVVAT